MHLASFVDKFHHIVSIDAISIEDMPEEPAIYLLIGTGLRLPEAPLPPDHRFGIVDLWKIRSTKRHFTFYR